MLCSFGRTEIFVDEEKLRRNIEYSEQISLTYTEICADPNLMGSVLFGYKNNTLFFKNSVLFLHLCQLSENLNEAAVWVAILCSAVVLLIKPSFRTGSYKLAVFAVLIFFRGMSILFFI